MRDYGHSTTQNNMIVYTKATEGNGMITKVTYMKDTSALRTVYIPLKNHLSEMSYR